MLGSMQASRMTLHDGSPLPMPTLQWREARPRVSPSCWRVLAGRDGIFKRICGPRALGIDLSHCSGCKTPPTTFMYSLSAAKFL